MAFSFLQRGNLSDHARQLTLTSYEPSLLLEGLSPGIDNLRHDVFLSPKFTEAARTYIAKLIARHGNVEELSLEDTASRRISPQPPARGRDSNAPAPRQVDASEFKRLLTELHLASLNRAKL